MSFRNRWIVLVDTLLELLTSFGWSHSDFQEVVNSISWWHPGCDVFSVLAIDDINKNHPRKLQICVMVLKRCNNLFTGLLLKTKLFILCGSNTTEAPEMFLLLWRVNFLELSGWLYDVFVAHPAPCSDFRIGAFRKKRFVPPPAGHA